MSKDIAVWERSWPSQAPRMYTPSSAMIVTPERILVYLVFLFVMAVCWHLLTMPD